MLSMGCKVRVAAGTQYNGETLDAESAAVIAECASEELTFGQISSAAACYAGASPFPHLVIDDAFPDGMLADAVAHWPASDSSDWKRFQSGKRASMNRLIPGPILSILDAFNTPDVCQFLSRLTGIEDLQPDTDFAGAGLHESPPGATLGIHTDFNRLGSRYRRLNVILYLNRDWQAEYGGQLILSDTSDVDPTDLTSRQAAIVPVWNRLVIQESSERSWHGHPVPVSTPDGAARRSLAWYYYTAKPGPGYSEKHSTIYAGRKRRKA